MSVESHIERLEQEAASFEKSAVEARAKLAMVDTIRAKYPDVEPAFVRRYKYNNKGGYSDYENVQIWESYDAAADANIVDPLQLSVDQNEMASPNFATHVLYVNVPTAHGIVRVYSAERVDIITAVDRFQSGEESTLVNALRGTEYAASVEYLVRCEKVEKAQKARDAEREARRQSEAIAKAQPVVVVGTVVTKSAE